MEAVLVDDCLGNIMNYLTIQTLDRVALVNKRWYSISRNHSKWSNIFKKLSSNNSEKLVLKREQVLIYSHVGYMCDICYGRISTYETVNNPPQPYIDESTKDIYKKICNACFYSETMHQYNKYICAKRKEGLPENMLQHIIKDREFFKGINFAVMNSRLEKRLSRYYKLKDELSKLSLCIRTDSRLMWTYIIRGKPNLTEVLCAAYETNQKFIVLQSINSPKKMDN